MLNQIIFITYLYFIYGLYANGLFYNKFYGFATKENFISYKAFKDIQSDLVCLNLCNREVDCLAAYFNGKIQTCLLYNYRIAPDSLISQLLGVYFLAQSKPLEIMTFIFKLYVFLRNLYGGQL